MAALIKKEDVSTDNIYEYNFDYETGEFSGYWLKFKYVNVPMDTRDPFAPVQDNNAYAVYDCYLFDTDDISSIARAYSVDYFYVDKDTYDDMVEGDPKTLEDNSIIPYEVTDGIMTVNKFYIPDNFNIEDYIPEEPVEPEGKEYVTARILDESVDDVNNIIIGKELLTKLSREGINSPLIHTVESSGHAESGVDFGIMGVMGLPSVYKYNEIFGSYAEYFTMTYNIENNPMISIYLSDGVVTNDGIETRQFNEITRNYHLNEDFNIYDDHTYNVMIQLNTSDVQTTGVLHVYPRLLIDNELVSTQDTDQYLDFNLSQGTQPFVTWVNDFTNNIYLFKTTWVDDEHDTIADIPFELSDCTIMYTIDADVSQLNPGTEEGNRSWTLNATSINTLSDGTDEYTLVPTSYLKGTQDEPSE